MQYDTPKPDARITANLADLTADPETVERANALLDQFSALTVYQHGTSNPHLALLARTPTLELRKVLEFLCIWYSFSRRTPQILLYCAASYFNQADRKLIMVNYAEEDGVGDGMDPHYDLLEALIEKMGGKLALNPIAEMLIKRFMAKISTGMSEAYATGVVAGFEHPALDITNILMSVIEKADGGSFQHLLEEDFYLRVHVAVEPDHIVWAHGNCLAFMARGEQEKAEVIRGFRDVMEFWTCFWNLAMGVVFDDAGMRAQARGFLASEAVA